MSHTEVYRGGYLMSRRKNIQRRMQQCGITQQQLAQHSVLSVKALNLWLDNKMTIPYVHLLRIADLLDLEFDDLVEVV